MAAAAVKVLSRQHSTIPARVQAVQAAHSQSTERGIVSSATDEIAGALLFILRPNSTINGRAWGVMLKSVVDKDNMWRYATTEVVSEQ